jgi:cellulose biosynthesis protein BcsQ
MESFGASLALLAQDSGLSAFLTPDLIGKAVGGVFSLGAAGSVGWALARRTYANKVRFLKSRSEHYETVYADAAGERDKQSVLAEKLQTEYASSTAKLVDLSGRYSAVLKAAHAWRAHALKLDSSQKGWQKEVHRLRREVEELTSAKLKFESESQHLGVISADRQAAIERAERRMRRALKLEGQLWAAKALQGRPAFRDLARRQRAVIAVLNLKGGVGKTTVTAHLGAALAHRGYRVLVIDLDLQGSLTSMLLPQDKISSLFHEKLLLQNFFNRAAEDKRTKITSFAQPIFDVPESGGSLNLVGTTDSLAYAELNLTVRWLLQSGSRDTRFLLRKALHLISCSRAFDIVLLDCPPVMNISCVNALAASDYLVVPTMLSEKSIERVPRLLERTLRSEKFLKFVNHELRVLGIVANRTLRDELNGVEQDSWERLAKRCKDVYKQPVTRFKTTIPQILGDVRESEAEFGPPNPRGKLAGVFARLAAEIEQELPNECRRLAKTSQ